MKARVEKMVYGGDGLVRIGERAVFVPFTLPGEVVEFDNESKPRNHTIENTSSLRVEPACSHFGVCGGCQYQHATYESQLEIKTGILQETMDRAGVMNLPSVVRHVAAPWGYRNRIRMKINGKEAQVGYSRRGTGEFLAIKECPIAAPLLVRAAFAFANVLNNLPGAHGLRSAVEVELFCSGDGAQLQMTVFTRGKSFPLSNICERIKEKVPQLTGAGVAFLTAEGSQRARRLERPRAGDSWGAEGLIYEAAGERYWVSRGGFFQVNRFLINDLVKVVAEGRSGRLAWDLYSGVGLFSRVLARGFAEVVAVEGGEAAAADLNSFKAKGFRAVRQPVVEFLRDAVIQRERPDLIVMDPPRAGLGAEGCELLGRLQVAEIAYVSCDPVTLARDLKQLQDAGYQVVEMHMIDLFPQTFHIETMALLRHGKRAKSDG